jgi:hypothetical protein
LLFPLPSLLRAASSLSFGQRISEKHIMKKTTARIALGISLAATAFAGAAYAEQTTRGADRDRTMTRAEAQTQATATFARMDANKDGKIDTADREARRNAHFDRLDSDRNGQLSRAEFAARPERGPGADAGKPGEGGKGHRWGGRGHGRGHHGGGMMMGRAGALGADADKDGAVTQAEFTAGALARFDAMDANKDGSVTKEERQAARQAMRAQWQSRAGTQPGPAN